MAGEEGDDMICIEVSDGEGAPLIVVVERSTPFGVIKAQYARLRQKPPGDIKLTLAISDGDTPETMGWRNDVKIQANMR